VRVSAVFQAMKHRTSTHTCFPL